MDLCLDYGLGTMTATTIKYSACLLFSYLSSALVKAEQDVLLELTNLIYISRLKRRDVS